MNNLLRGRWLTWLALWLLMATSLGAQEELPAGSIGAWKRSDGALLRIEAGRILVYEDGGLTVRGIRELHNGRAVLLNDGKPEVWQLGVNGQKLSVRTGDKAQQYLRLPEIPAEVRLVPAPLGEPIPLPPQRVRDIQEELDRRMKRDQEVLRDISKAGEKKTVDSDNINFLRLLIKEVGWIDSERFGIDASCDAAILAQHSIDLPIMLAALPFVERDLKASPEGVQVYAVFYDALQIALGGTQRYGSRFGQDHEGNPIVLPLENRAELEKYRKDVGLPPMADYLKLAEQYLYPGKTIRFADDL